MKNVELKDGEVFAISTGHPDSLERETRYFIFYRHDTALFEASQTEIGIASVPFDSPWSTDGERNWNTELLAI